MKFNESSEYEVKIYPPGGQQVDVELIPEDEKEKDKKNNDLENYYEDVKLPFYYVIEKYQGEINDWIGKFIEKGGYDFICDLYLSEESAISAKLKDIYTMNDEEKTCVQLLLDIVGTFNIVAAYVKDPSINHEELQKQNSKTYLPNIDEDAEMLAEDEYEINEEDLLGNLPEIDPTRERTLSAITKEKDEEDLVQAKIELCREFDHAGITSHITPSLADRILNKFDYEKFVSRSLTTLNTVISKRSLTQRDKEIVAQNMHVVISIFLYEERSLKVLYNFRDEETKTDLKEFIIKGMTFSSDPAIKGIFMNAIKYTCEKVKHTKEERLPLIVILEIMKDHFFESIKESSRYYGYKEFYQGFRNLLVEYFKVKGNRNKKFENIIEPKIFLKQLIEILKNYKTKEKRNTVLEDHCLIGIFEILECILCEMPEFIEPSALKDGLLNELWTSCLFQTTNEAPQIDLTAEFDQNSTDLHANKCKTKESRAKAFSLLTLLTTNSEKVRESVYRDCLSQMVSHLERPENFSTKPDNEGRSFYSFSGLRNQGATCYMNSMIQQLFMIPTFKYLFLSINDGIDEDLGTLEDEKSVYHNKMMDDNLLHQLQNTFSFLELSERPFYNALGLCFSMKDYSGAPTNCSLQQDSQEFLNLCFDRLENMIKPTPQHYIIRDIFSAKQCTHMTCSQCGFVKQRIEDFYILSLPVKGFKTLEDSFNAFTDGEVINDFTCDNCEQKVDIKKNCSFVDMPNILMIHLQKTFFNMDTFMNEKLSDRYEFPTYLNMDKFTINNVAKKHGINDPDLYKYSENEDKNFEYRLIGVIIHQGVADGGHYYSLICTDTKLRDPKEKQWTTTENLKWNEFNDTEVKDFNFRSKFEDECFGKNSKDIYGPSGGSEFDVWGTGGSSKSAYVLVYEKREYNDIRLKVDMQIVKEHGKSPEDVRKLIEEEKQSYLRSIYTSHNYSRPKEEEKEDEVMDEEDKQVKFMEDLEAENISVPRNLFKYLIIPHQISVFMTQEQRDQLKYISIQYNKDESDCILNVKYSDVQKYVPYKIFKKVLGR